MDQRIIGENLRRIREAKGFSQSHVADIAGISRVAYRNIENGTSTPKVSTLQNVATGVGVKLQDLFVPIRTLKKVRFRAQKKMNSREYILTEVARWLDDYNDLENLLNVKESYIFKELSNDLFSISAGPDRAKQTAKLAREKLKLVLHPMASLAYPFQKKMEDLLSSLTFGIVFLLNDGFLVQPTN